MPIKSLKKIINLTRTEQQSDTNKQMKANGQIIFSEQSEQDPPRKSSSIGRSEEYSSDVNQVIVWQGQHQGQEKVCYYIPAYLRVQINRVNRIDYLGCSAQIDLGIHLWLMIKQLPEDIQERIINTGEIKINGCSNIKLKDIEIRKNNSAACENTSKNVAQFYAHQILTMQLECDNFYSPFELINIQGKVQLREFSYSEKHKKTVIQFNFMETDPFLHFRFNQLRNLGNYQLAEGKVAMKFSNEEFFGKMTFSIDKTGQLIEEIIMPSVMKKKLDHHGSQQMDASVPPNQYKNATIVISLYKYPLANMITIFIPFYLLSILCLGVFFTVNFMGTRSLSIFLLLMSYMAMIPGIRRTIPPTPSLIMVQILIYLQAVCIVAIFVQSIIIRNQQDYVFYWYQDRCFLFVLAFTVINFVYVMGLCIAHKCIWEPNYNRISEGTQKKLNMKFNTDEWFNDTCQLYFNKYKEQNRISFPYPYRASQRQIHKAERKVTQKVKFVEKKSK